MHSPERAQRCLMMPWWQRLFAESFQSFLFLTGKLLQDWTCPSAIRHASTNCEKWIFLLLRQFAGWYSDFFSANHWWTWSDWYWGYLPILDRVLFGARELSNLCTSRPQPLTTSLLKMFASCPGECYAVIYLTLCTSYTKRWLAMIWIIESHYVKALFWF